MALTTTIAGAVPAQAEGNRANVPPRLALSSPPASRSVALVDTPRAATEDAPASKSSSSTSWLPWVVIAAGAAIVGGVLFLANGKDPACPGGRVCQ